MSTDNFSAVWYDGLEKNRRAANIAEDIKKRYKVQLDIEEIKDIIKYLVSDCNYTFEDIENEKANTALLSLMGIEAAKKDSIETIKGKSVKIPLDTKRKSLSRTVVSLLMVFAISANGMGMAINGIGKTFENEPIFYDEPEIIQTVEEVSLVEQCTIIKGQRDGINVTYFDVDMLADKIINKCRNNPELFEPLLAIVYFDLDTERLITMDELFAELRDRTVDNEELSHIYGVVKNNEVFLDYLKLKLINPSDHKYSDIQNIIFKYKNLAGQYAYRNSPFEALAPEEQTILKEFLINKYEGYNKGVKPKYSNLVNSLDENLDEEFKPGGRPSGS